MPGNITLCPTSANKGGGREGTPRLGVAMSEEPHVGVSGDIERTVVQDAAPVNPQEKVVSPPARPSGRDATV